MPLLSSLQSLKRRPKAEVRSSRHPFSSPEISLWIRKAITEEKSRLDTMS